MSKQPSEKINPIVLEISHQEILEKADHLYDVLTNLRFEGKIALGKNTAETAKMLDYFQKRLVEHMKLEELIFPYLQVHIPKLESAIRFLQTEHKEIKVSLEILRSLLEELSVEKSEIKRATLQDKIKDKGIYFVYLLRSHVQAEEEGIFRPMNEDLRIEEKREIQKKIASFFKGGHNNVPTGVS